MAVRTLINTAAAVLIPRRRQKYRHGIVTGAPVIG